MTPFPHRYVARAAGASTGDVRLDTPGVEALATNAPPEFGGPAGRWSPESLLAASVADCYVLSFRAAARGARVAWTGLSVDVEGVLDRIKGVTRFTHFVVRPTLTLPAGADEAAANAALERAERLCLISNSLSATTELQARVLVADVTA